MAWLGWFGLNDAELASRLRELGMPTSVAEDWVEYREAPTVIPVINRFFKEAKNDEAQRNSEDPQGAPAQGAVGAPGE